MYIRIKKNNHFLNLLTNSESAQRYFLNKNVEEFNNSRLNDLQVNLRKAKRKYSRMSSVLSIAHFFKVEKKINIASKLEMKHQELENSVHELEIFESNLAYLIISESINIDDCCKKNNLNPGYLIALLEKSKKQVARPFLEYTYDENTGQVSEITEDGKCIILPYIPYAVKNEIDKKRRKQRRQDELIQQLDSSDDELLNKINRKIQSLDSDDDVQGHVYKKRMTR